MARRSECQLQRLQLDNDGIFDTPLSSNPTVSNLYPDEVNVTAVVKAVKGRRSATDSVTFSTLRCGGGGGTPTPTPIP